MSLGSGRPFITIAPRSFPRYFAKSSFDFTSTTIGVPVSGATVHFVTPELDHGPIVAQAAVPSRTYRDIEVGYRFAYPGDWTVTPGDGRDNYVRVTLTPPGAANAACTVAIADSERYSGLTQAQLDWSTKNHPFGTEDWLASLGTLFTKVNITSQAAVVIGKRPTRYATAEAVSAKGLPTEMIMFYALSPGRTWHVTCGASGADAAAAAANFKTRRTEFQRVMSTFIWEEK